MKVAITGENGFLGYHLKNYYTKKGDTVIQLSKNFLQNIHLIEQCDLLIHAAGINRSNIDENIFTQNISITTDLIKSLEKNNIKVNIKFISSIQEDNDNSYGRAKRECKALLEKYCLTNNVKFESYKVPNLFGTHGKPYYNSVVNTFCYNIINNIPCVFNYNNIKLCWVYDAIEVIDNQRNNFHIYETQVDDLYNSIQQIHNGSKQDTSLYQRLETVYNYFKQTKIKVLVLGHTGMLGFMVKKYFESINIVVDTINARYPSDTFNDLILDYKGDFIINCIGSIPQKTTFFKTNTDLPIWLCNNAPCRVIHPGTDCEIDNDAYGISKKIASDYIQLYGHNTKILKTSIIGPEQGIGYGLMGWFLSQKTKVQGYTKAIWNGNTTLEWAKQAYNLILNWHSYPTLTILEGEPITKYNLLILLKELYHKDIDIVSVELGKDKTLKGNIKTKALYEQLVELKNFT